MSSWNGWRPTFRCDPAARYSGCVLPHLGDKTSGPATPSSSNDDARLEHGIGGADFHEGLARELSPGDHAKGAVDRVMVEQMRAVDLHSLGGTAGRLDASELRLLDEALTLVLGLY